LFYQALQEETTVLKVFKVVFMQENTAKKETTYKPLTANLIVSPSCVTVKLNGDTLEHHKAIN